MMDNHDRAIGRIEGKLDRLIEEQTCASKRNGELYLKMENIQRKQDFLDQQIVAIDQRLEWVEQPVIELNRWHERAIGALMLVSVIAAAVGGSTVFFWQKIISSIK